MWRSRRVRDVVARRALALSDDTCAVRQCGEQSHVGDGDCFGERASPRNDGIFLFHSHIEIVVCGFCQIANQRIDNVPNIGDGVVGVDGQDEISAGGVYDANVACVTDNTVVSGDITMFMRHERSIWHAALNQRA